MTTVSPTALRPRDVPPDVPREVMRPRMRGRLHTYAFFVAVVCGIVVCSLAATQPGAAPVVSCAIYSVTVCALFGVSALYHRRVWTVMGFRLMRRLDHSMIFLFIAGTYTPVAVLTLPAPLARTVLAIVWGGALAGVALKLVWPYAPRWIGTLLYTILGWVALPILPDLLDRDGVVVVVLLAAGGLVYTLGGLCYAMRRPNPWPTVFGHHELFHACTLMAASCHHVAIYIALYA